MRGKLNPRPDSLWTSAWRWFVRFPLGAKGGKVALYGLLLLAIGLPVFASSSTQAPLELLDGRVFQSWSVIRQTDNSLTIKHAKGAAKIMKVLLPPEILTQYPIVEKRAPVPPKLPPEPAGLDKTQAERSISARDSISGIDVRWTCRIVVEGSKGEITRTSKNRAGEFKTDFAFSFGLEDVASFEENVAKAVKWSATVAEKKPPRFSKSMGEVLGREWTFVWDTSRFVIRTGMNEAPTLEAQDLEKIQILLSALPYMQQERLAEAEAGENFADSLK